MTGFRRTHSQNTGRQCQFRSVPAFAGSGRDKPDLASVTDVEDLQIPDSCRRPVGRSAAWWGSNKREFIVWKCVL